MRTAPARTDRRPGTEVAAQDLPFPAPTYLPSPGEAPSTDVGRTALPAEPGLTEALHDVATAGQELLVDRLELFKLEVTETVRLQAEKAKDMGLLQVEKVKESAREQVEKVSAQAARAADVAKEQAARALILAFACVMFAITWGLLCGAAVVALSGPLGVAEALAIVSAPHAAIGIALVAKASRKHPRPGRG